ncbi:GL22787 [Drosophila persimilis]|uniref:GL22787 n=1 Tax=Drosophila persimilis TaxID=7234 RepID=B4GZK0_DROPE|nr:GL22787 [Drosophila persimilis]
MERSGWGYYFLELFDIAAVLHHIHTHLKPGEHHAVPVHPRRREWGPALAVEGTDTVMAPRRSARTLASPAATPLIRRAAFRRAVEAIPGRVRITTTASQRRRTTTTASRRRRTTTTASRRRAIQSAANQPPAEDPPVTNRRGINSRGINRRGTNRLPVQDTAPIVTLLQNPDPQRGTGSHAGIGALTEFGTKLGLRRLRMELAKMTSDPTDGCTVGVSGRLYLRLERPLFSGPWSRPTRAGHF